jgi:hypothetical protein
MPKDVEEKAVQELKRLEAMPPMSAEATVSRKLPRLADRGAVAQEDARKPRPETR